MTVRKYPTLALRVFFAVLAVVPLSAQQITPWARHYLVELEESATAVDDVDAVAAQLSRAYGGRVEMYAAVGFHGFAISMTEEKARLLAADPRVKSLRENAGNGDLQKSPMAPVARPALVAAPNAIMPPIEIGPYKYDAAGNVIHSGADRYTYDRMGRIVSGTAATIQNFDTQKFSYDGFGNLKTIEIPSKSILYIDIDPSNNKLKSTAGAETGTNVSHTWAGGTDGGYDAAGNQTAVNGGSYLYTFDSLNALKAMSSPRHELYIYDGDEERIATVTYSDSLNATWRYTLRDATGRVLREVSNAIAGGTSSWKLQKDYVYRGATPLATITPQAEGGEQRTHFHLDHLGTPVLITDDVGQSIAVRKYWPFGGDAPGSDSDGERMRFTGHERDVAGSDVNALDYMHARYYRSVAGRFLSLDPRTSWQAPLTQTWNPYAYAVDNPVKYVDADGREITIAVKRQGNVINVNVRITVEIHNEDGPRPKASEWKDTLQRAADILSPTFPASGGHNEMRVSTTIDAIFTNDGDTDLSRHQMSLDRSRGILTGYADAAEQGGNEAYLGITSPKWVAHEVAHWLGLPDDPDLDPRRDDDKDDNNLMNHNDGLTEEMTREQWLEIWRAYLEHELNKGVEP